MCGMIEWRDIFYVIVLYLLFIIDGGVDFWSCDKGGSGNGWE